MSARSKAPGPGRRVALWLLGNLGALVVRLVTSTLRMRTEGRAHREALEADGRPPIYTFWHGRQLPLLGWDYPAGTAVLVSLSRDGDLQTRILEALGFVAERGSGGGAGARGLVRLVRRVREGRAAAFAVDGGRGPLHTVHEGALVLAARTGRPVVPVGVSVRRRHVFMRAWDRYVLPLPFTSGAVVLGEPLEVPRRAPREILAALADELGRRLHDATREADRLAGAPPEPAAEGHDPCPVCAAGRLEALGGAK